MTRDFTKKDVFLYFANRLSRSRRLELEAASMTDAHVKQWFTELTPTPAELEVVSLLADEAELDDAWIDEWLKHAVDPNSPMPRTAPEPGKLYASKYGIVSRDRVGLAGKPINRAIRPGESLSVHRNDRGTFLEIEVPGNFYDVSEGGVKIVIVRPQETGVSERKEVPCQLQGPDDDGVWYATLRLNDIFGEGWPGEGNYLYLVPLKTHSDRVSGVAKSGDQS